MNRETMQPIRRNGHEKNFLKDNVSKSRMRETKSSFFNFLNDAEIFDGVITDEMF